MEFDSLGNVEVDKGPGTLEEHLRYWNGRDRANCQTKVKMEDESELKNDHQTESIAPENPIGPVKETTVCI